jgi:hypothetical protein
MKKGIIALLTIMFFCNFGRVEYSALNPKSKTIKSDSMAKSSSFSTPAVVKADTGQSEQESTDVSEESIDWANYVVIGIKTFFGTLLKLLVA